MRVTNAMQVSFWQTGIENSLSNLNDVQQQIATGRKLNQPSDDPAGAAQAMVLNASLVNNNQYQRDVTSAQGFLSASDGAYSTTENIILTARQIASQGANSTNDANSYTSLTQQVDALVTQLINVANTTVGGKYVFSGTLTQTPPYVDNAAAHATQPAYQGNGGSISTTVGIGTTITINTPGSTVFDPIFTTLANLKANLTAAGAGTPGAITNISADLTTLDDNLGTTSAANALVGAQLNQLQTTQQQLQKANIDFQQSLSNIQDVDLAQAYVQLQSDQNVYQASLASTAKAFQFTLTDFLK